LRELSLLAKLTNRDSSYSFETLITNSRFTFMKMYNSRSNAFVAYLRVLDIYSAY